MDDEQSEASLRLTAGWRPFGPGAAQVRRPADISDPPSVGHTATQKAGRAKQILSCSWAAARAVSDPTAMFDLDRVAVAIRDHILVVSCGHVG
jgi:hypothetical protein